MMICLFYTQRQYEGSFIGSATNVTESFFRQIPTHDPCVCIHANYIFNYQIFSKENVLDEAFQFGINQNFRNLWYIYCFRSHFIQILKTGKDLLTDMKEQTKVKLMPHNIIIYKKQ